MTLHVNLIEDSDGDLVDIEYYCSQFCAEAADVPQPSAWPGNCETDYDLYCAHCEDHIKHGLQCPADCSEES